jgi:hypothetical protein
MFYFARSIAFGQSSNTGSFLYVACHADGPLILRLTLYFRRNSKIHQQPKGFLRATTAAESTETSTQSIPRRLLTDNMFFFSPLSHYSFDFFLSL